MVGDSLGAFKVQSGHARYMTKATALSRVVMPLLEEAAVVTIEALRAVWTDVSENTFFGSEAARIHEPVVASDGLGEFDELS